MSDEPATDAEHLCALGKAAVEAVADVAEDPEVDSGLEFAFGIRDEAGRNALYEAIGRKIMEATQ